MQVPIDERVTDGPDWVVMTDGPDSVVVTDGPDWVVVPPDVSTAFDDRDDGADGRETASPSTSAAPASTGSTRSPATQRWNHEDLIPERPAWMDAGSYRQLAELRRELEQPTGAEEVRPSTASAI